MSTANMLLRRQRMLVDRTVLARVRYRNKIRELQVSSREGVVIDGIEHIEPYGFTSHARAGAECVVLNAGGRSGRGIVIMVNDRRHRIVVSETETAIYTANGEMIHLKADNSIHVKAASRVFLEAPETELSGDLIVRGDAQFDGSVHADGDIDSDADVSAGDISMRNHRHNGVDTGSGTSGGAVV